MRSEGRSTAAFELTREEAELLRAHGFRFSIFSRIRNRYRLERPCDIHLAGDGTVTISQPAGARRLATSSLSGAAGPSTMADLAWP